MRARPWLARLYVEMKRLDEATEQVTRCRQVLAAGEDWRGLAGNVALAEAVVAGERGDYDIAYRQFEAALAIHQKYHLAWAQADTLHYWGRVLAAAGDRARAAEKFDAAIENHRSRGVGPRFLDWLTADKMRALGAMQTQIDVGATDGSAASAISTLSGVFRREGEFWTIAYAGATFRLKDAKGLHYIAYLLEHPAIRIHVLDLIRAVDGSPTDGRTSIHAESEDLKIVRDIGGAGPTIDARARAEYRTRLHELRAELDEAERFNDLGRRERVNTEIEMVIKQLTASSGLGGRARAKSETAERARGLVRKSIHATLEKIRCEHPALGRYLAAVLTTGNFCAYQPDPDRPVSWQF
jgi:non-specific serine/threonine protein kinase